MNLKEKIIIKADFITSKINYTYIKIEQRK